MEFNLIEKQWIPVLRRDGTKTMIAPWEVTGQFADNPVVSLNAPRPDFNGALIQFLIGLVQTTAAPASRIEWKQKLRTPPSGDELKEKFTTVRHAFELGGDGPRFMQDLENISAEFGGIEGLFVESPGEHTKDQNKDHFVKRDSVEGICPICCATALFTFQTNSPSGGPGYMTSLRGGGPFTTLVKGDDHHNTLWQLVYLNVLECNKFNNICGNSELTEGKYTFPWLGKTKKGKRKKGDVFYGEDTVPFDAHPATMFWAMPRRIRLNLSELSSGHCDVCGDFSDSLICAYKEIPGGASYTGWCHPLSPHYEEVSKGLLPIHAQPSGVSYRHWLGLVITDENEKKIPARIVHEFYDRWKSNWQFRLWSFGYDMDKMKARCWYESTMPLFCVDLSIRPDYETTIANMIKAAVMIGEDLRIALKNSIHGKVVVDQVTKKIKWEYRDIKKLPSDEDKRRAKILYETRDNTALISMDSIFWQNTESRFYELLSAISKCYETGTGHQSYMQEWHNCLCDEAQKLFDFYSWEDCIEDSNPKRIVVARSEMQKLNRSNKVKSLLNL
jgi:CRISPR system Cascade subunit CasA